eukprot:scaffold276978_cov18-Tisochrysis_lutea.AAC.1
MQIACSNHHAECTQQCYTDGLHALACTSWHSLVLSWTLCLWSHDKSYQSRLALPTFRITCNVSATCLWFFLHARSCWHNCIMVAKSTEGREAAIELSQTLA